MLYIVSTPIGNLEDITFRAVRVLKEVNFILAEDTRRTGKLLFHLKIKKEMLSYNDVNKKKKTPGILKRLESEDAALVSDSGTPLISDPGFYLVRECISSGILVSPIPGPSAFLAALTCSGFPTDRFHFYGFMPKSKRKKIIQNLEEKTAIFYESPYRIKKTLEELLKIYPDREIFIAREITKKFEEFIRGTTAEVYEKIKNRNIKGEITLIIKGMEVKDTGIKP